MEQRFASHIVHRFYNLPPCKSGEDATTISLRNTGNAVVYPDWTYVSPSWNRTQIIDIDYGLTEDRRLA